MSVIKKVLVMCFVLVLCVCVCSCTQKDDDFLELIPDEPHDHVQETQKENGENSANASQENTQPTESRKEIDALANAAIEKMQIIPEYPAGYPTLDDVVSQYKKATMAVGWIINTEDIATDSSDTHESQGMTYQRVKPDCHYGAHEHSHHADELGETDKLIYNKESFEAYLATLIHPEEAKDYMLDLKEGYDVPRLIEGKNGALYALPFYYTPSGYGKEETYQLEANGDGSYTFIVNYTVLGSDGEEKPRQYKTDYVKVDGRWVFENFRVYRQ